MTLLYVALTDGTTTLVLTDGTNFTLENDGWYPTIALDSEQRTVIDSIKINILGATTSGGPSDAGRVRVNQVTLLTMLRQIQRGQEGDGGVVRLIYTSPGSSPARRIASQVTAWDPSGMMPDLNNEINLTGNEINGVTLTLEHRTPWVWQSYLYDNLYTTSLWATTPTPTAILGTAAFSATAGYYGGGGLIRLTHTTTGTSSIYNNDTISATIGVPITVTFSAAWSGSVTNIAFWLIDGASTVSRSNAVNNAVTGSAALADGRRFTATVTPTASGALRMFWQVTGPNGSITDISEVFAHSTEAETWHRDAAIEGTSGISAGTARSVVQTSAIPATPAPAPTYLFYGHAVTTWATGVVVVAKTGNLTTYPLPPAAALSANFTSLADAANNAIGNILRYTPVATTAVAQIVEGPAAMDGNYNILAARIIGAASYTISLVAYEPLSGTVIASARAVTLTPRTMPYYLCFERMSTNSGSYGALGYYLSITASAAAGNIDFDWWASVVDAEDTTILTHDVSFAPSQLNTHINPNWITGVIPTGLVSKDNLLTMSRATSLDTMWAATTNTTLWRTTLTPTLTVLRSPAFDAPL